MKDLAFYLAAQRNRMLNEHLIGRGIKNAAVLAAMMMVPREEFVAEHLRESAYEDHPLPIDEGQTISQPYIVAYMAEMLELSAEDRVLEIGTGSGYAAAILSRIVNTVYTVEHFGSLCRRQFNVIKISATPTFMSWKLTEPWVGLNMRRMML